MAAAAFYVRAQSQGQSANPGQTQTPGAWTLNRNVVVLDPAHGGADGGNLLGDHTYEKDVTLAVATKLRTALTTAGFTVISTRDADLFDPLTYDQRADIANRAHAVACVVIHASASGSGVHLYSSALMPTVKMVANDEIASTAFVATPWERAQVGFISQSQQMTKDLGAALGQAHLPVVIGHGSIRPLDNLTCPAVALEIAPLTAGSDVTPLTDQGYQQRVANTLSAALLAWRDHAVPLAPPSSATGAQTVDPATKTLATKTAVKPAVATEAAGLAVTKAHKPVSVPYNAHATTNKSLVTSSKNPASSSFMSKAPVSKNPASTIKTNGGAGRTWFTGSPTGTSLPATPPTHTTVSPSPSPSSRAITSSHASTGGRASQAVIE